MRELACVLFLLLAAAPALGHGPDTSTLSSRADLRLPPGAVVLGVGFESGSHLASSDDDPGFTEELSVLALRPVLALSPLRDLVLAFQAPLTRKSITFLTDGYPPTSSTASGLGDVDVEAGYLLLARTPAGSNLRHSLTLRLGTSLPTGNNGVQREGLRLDEHVQLGTGALAPRLLAHYRVDSLAWSLRANLTGKLPLINSYDYGYGPSLSAGVQGGWAVAPWLTLLLGLDARYAGRDSHLALLQTNTGGFLLTGTAGVEVHATAGLSVFAAAQLPLARRLFGHQEPRPAFTLGLDWLVE